MVPILPRIIDRCINFLSNRSTPSAIQSAIIILSKLKPTYKLSQLANVLWTAIKFPNQIIQKMAVDLYFLCLAHFTYSDDLSKAMMSMCNVCIQANSNLSETFGAFIVIRTFINRGFDIIAEKFSDIFPTIANLLTVNHDPIFFEVFALLCETHKLKAKDVINRILDVLRSDWNLNDNKICDQYIRIAALFPDEFGKISYEYAQTVNDNSYFKLISVKFDASYSDEVAIIKKFESSKLSLSYIDGAYMFLKSYPHNAFKFIPILVRKIEEVLVSENPINAFKLICKFENGIIFPFQNYWEPIFESLKYPDLTEDDKEQRVLALLSILRNDPKDQYQKLLSLLFFLQNDSIPVYCTALDNIDSSLLPLFMNDPLKVLLASYTNDNTGKYILTSVNLFIRLRKVSPLSTFNFFISMFNMIPSTYMQCTSYVEKRKLIKIWETVINGADDLIAPYANSLYHFFLELIGSSQPKTHSFKDQANYRKIIKEAINIHISAMKCIEKLVQKPYPYDPQKIVDAVIGQLTVFHNDESIHIATLNTLRSVFRSFGIVNINMESLHMKLFNFMKATKSETILYSILSVLGTIGPLDPLSFHMKHDTGDMLPLYDKTKREQCYLDFVMRYLLAQLTTSHESSVLLNAILYVFQFDAHKSSVYLSDIIPVLEKLLHRGLADSVFHIIRSIILLVEIEIFPFAQRIYSMLSPYLVYSNFNLQALKAISAIVFIMKSTFQPMAIQTFSMVLNILTNNCGFDYELYLLQILTHLVIFCNCSQRLYFKQIQKRALSVTLISSYALNFLSQVILHTPYEELCLPSIGLAIFLMNNKSPIKESAQNLLSILAEKCPIYIPKGIDVTKISKLSNACEVTSDPYPQRTPPPIHPLSVSEIFNKNNFMQFENNWDNWLLHLSQNLVLCSNSPAIRACHPLLQISTSFEHQLFPLILIAVWEIATEEDRGILSSHLAAVAMNPNTPVELLGIFCDAIDAMDRAGYVLFSTAEISGSIAVRSEHFFRAVRFYERAQNVDDNIKCQMIKIHARLQRRESALGIFAVTQKAHRDTSILQELGIWSEAKKLYVPDRSESDFVGYIECCSKLEDWGTIMKCSERFDHLSPESKSLSSIFFASATTFYELKGIEKFLPYTTRSTPVQCLWQAIIALHMGKNRNARLFIERGMKLNAANRAPFLSGNYEPALPSIEVATFLEELRDVVDVRENRISSDKVLQLWNSKSDWIKSDVEQLRTLFVVRQLLESNDHLLIGLNFLDVARKLKAWSIYDNSIERFLGSYDDERVTLLRAKIRYDRRQCTDFSEILHVINTTTNPTVYASAVCGYAARLQTPTPELLDLLKTVLSKTPHMIRALKHWTYGNLYCAGRYEDKMFANNAMRGFIELIKHNRPYLHYLCQLCSLCFSYETNITDVFSSLPPSSIEQIVQQLLMQFDHPREDVRKSVTEIISNFAEHYLQAIVFPLSYIGGFDTLSPHLLDFLNEIRKKHPQFTSEVRTITKGLLNIAMTDGEMVTLIFDNAVNNFEQNADFATLIGEIRKALSYFRKDHAGVNKILEKHSIVTSFTFIENEIQQVMIPPEIEKTSALSLLPNSPPQQVNALISSHNSPQQQLTQQEQLAHQEQLTEQQIAAHQQIAQEQQQLTQQQISQEQLTQDQQLAQQQQQLSQLHFNWKQVLIEIKSLLRQLNKEISEMQTIDIAEIAPDLIDKAPFTVAVPGFYRLEGDFPTIKSFSRIAKMIPSAKYPRKIRIIGSDGRVYKYLLKGKEDLILDQRIMQWFSLANSLLKDDKSGIEKNLNIEGYAIIPLSPFAGMIAWAEQSETLHKLISSTIHLKHPEFAGQEMNLVNEFGISEKFFTMSLASIQRYEFYRELVQITDDTALREAIWVKSPGAEVWFTQKTNFARSLGLMSIVGYIIGLGDRHPSNILFMNNTGNNVHIDFSDCFEKAIKRNKYPEKVPFRLTRMMVKVLGVSGVEGDFKMTARFVMNLMRKNKSALLAFLDIFAKGNEDVGITQEEYERVKDKLNGNEFENEKDLPTETQVDRLIADATNDWNLAQMYIGWAPHW